LLIEKQTSEHTGTMLQLTKNIWLKKK